MPNINPSKIQYASFISTLLNDSSPDYSFDIAAQTFQPGNYFARTFTNSFNLNRSDLIANVRMNFSGLQSTWALGNRNSYITSNYNIECSIKYQAGKIIFVTIVVGKVVSGTYSSPAFTVNAKAVLLRAPWG